ncbi:MAG: NAD(P)H-dependent oxidoreductase subunit E [Bdellovibrio sp.]|nr:NAD(P)H-dependent oxidoreductase subunit E [Bdellovibrio sp.]
MFQLSAEAKQQVLNELKRYESKESAVLPALYIGQRENKGFINAEVIKALSSVMEIPESHINEVFTFYTMYNKTPIGKYHVQVCRTLSCMLNGAKELTAHLCKELNVKLNDVSGDGRFTVSEAECLGSCGTAPMMQINDKYYENLTPESAMNLLRGMK